jgi:uncharacterized UPF0160 family protein
MTGKEFLARLDYYGKAWLPARNLVAEALKARFAVEPSGQIILFETYLPWKVCPVLLVVFLPPERIMQEHLFELEPEHGIVAGGEHKLPLFTIYPDESGKWRVQAVSVTPESFENRKGLPEAWRGLRDAELSEASGVPDCVFVHASGFIGGECFLLLSTTCALMST